VSIHTYIHTGAQYKALPLPESDRFSKERQGEPETLIGQSIETKAIQTMQPSVNLDFVTSIISNSINQTPRVILLYTSNIFQIHQERKLEDLKNK